MEINMERLQLIIVEDEPGIQNGIRKLVEKTDLPVEVAGVFSSGQEVLEAFAGLKPDIVMTDVQMPAMTGLELIEELKKRGCAAEYLILSGYAEFEYVRTAIKLDVQNYLLKPPRLSEFRDSLSAICRKILERRHEEIYWILQKAIYQPDIQDILSDPNMDVVFRMMLIHWQPEDQKKDFSTDKAPGWREIKERIVSSGEQGLDPDTCWVLNGQSPEKKYVITEGTEDHSRLVYKAVSSLGRITAVTGEAGTPADLREEAPLLERYLLKGTVREEGGLHWLKEDDSNWRIDQVVEILWERICTEYAQVIDFGAFAKEHGYHPVYLNTQFSRRKHISPTKLQIQKRMEMAKKLLLSTDKSLKDIAEMTGYSDVSYFSRAFKEMEGMSPSAYRMQQIIVTDAIDKS